MTEKQAGSDLRATQTTARRPTARRGPGEAYRDRRPQVVLLGAAQRRLRHAGTHRSRPVLLPAAGLAARRLAQPPADPAAQGQVRQQVERLERDRVSRRARLAGRRGGPGHQGGARHDAPDAARLRHRLGRPDAPRAVRGDPPHERAPRLPAPAGRPAADAERAGRPRARGRGGDPARLPAGARGRRRAGRRRRAPRCWSASARRSASTGTASAPSASSHEALECHGGNGFIEEGPMARLYREAPLNGIWEGSGNVIALDVLRAAARSPQSVPAFLDEVRPSQGRRPPPRPDGRPRSKRSCSTATSTRRAHAASSRRWRSPCRRACSFATRRSRGRCVLRDAARWRRRGGLRQPACRPRPEGHRRARARGRRCVRLRRQSGAGHRRRHRDRTRRRPGLRPARRLRRDRGTPSRGGRKGRRGAGRSRRRRPLHRDRRD